MSDPLDVKRGDVGVTFTDQLQAKNAAGTLVPFDLTGGTLLFLMRDVKNSGTINVSGAGTIAAGTIGICSYLSASGDLAARADCRQEWEWTKGSQVLTFPSPGYNTIRIGEDLNPPPGS